MSEATGQDTELKPTGIPLDYEFGKEMQYSTDDFVTFEDVRVLGISASTYSDISARKIGRYLVCLRTNPDGLIVDSPESIESKALISVSDKMCSVQLRDKV